MKPIRITISQYLAADGLIHRSLKVYLMQQGFKFTDWAMSEIINADSILKLIKLEKCISDFYKNDVMWDYRGLRVRHNEYDDSALQITVMAERK